MVSVRTWQTVRSGKSCIIQSGPQFTTLAINDLPDGKLFLVGQKSVYCITNNR